MTDETFEVVYVAPTEMDVTIGKQLLEEAGIPVVVRPAGEAYFRIYFGQGYSGPTAQLLVPASWADYARLLLSDYQAKVDASAYGLKDEADPDVSP